MVKPKSEWPLFLRCAPSFPLSRCRRPSPAAAPGVFARFATSSDPGLRILAESSPGASREGGAWIEFQARNPHGICPDASSSKLSAGNRHPAPPSGVRPGIGREAWIRHSRRHRPLRIRRKSQGPRRGGLPYGSVGCRCDGLVGHTVADKIVNIERRSPQAPTTRALVCPQGEAILTSSHVKPEPPVPPQSPAPGRRRHRRGRCGILEPPHGPDRPGMVQKRRRDGHVHRSGFERNASGSHCTSRHLSRLGRRHPR